MTQPIDTFAQRTFSPFYLPERRGFKIAAWAAGLLMALGLLMFPMIKSFLGKLMILIKDPNFDPESVEFLNEIMVIYGSASAYLTLFNIAAAILGASVSAAFLRAVFRPDAPAGFFPLRLGMEEIRVFGARFIIGIVAIGIIFAVYLVVIILGVIAALLSEMSTGLAIAVGALAALSFLIGLAGCLYVMARLSPAASLCVRDQKFRLFEAWRVSKGRVWSMIGSFITAYLVFLIPIIILVTIISTAFLFGTGLSEAIADFHMNDDPMALMEAIGQALQSPVTVLIILTLGGIYTFVGSLMGLCFTGVPASVTKRWVSETQSAPTQLPYPTLKSKK